MAGNSELSILLSAVNKASSVIGDVGGSLDTLHGKAGRVQGALGGLNSLLGAGVKVAAGLAVGAIGALAVGIGVSVKAASDFEQGLADVGAAMGTSTAETAQLKKLIMDLGFDPKLKVNATEATAAIGALGTAGLSVDQILNGAAKSTVLLANATGADFADAASIATDVMAQFNIKAADLQGAVNGITGVTIASKFDINDYKLALAQAGGVAATVGVNFDDFNTTIAAISPFFASGSDAGTSFKTMLLALVPKSGDAATAMQNLGLITADGSNRFFDAAGNMKGMGEITGILNTALSGLSEQQKNEALATIFGTDAMRAAAAIGKITEEQFGELKTTIGKTDAEVSAAKRMDTLSGVMEIMWGVVDALKLQIGDKFLPIVRRMAEMFTEQAQIHGPALVAMFGKMADQLGTTLGAFLPWVETNLPLMIAQIPQVIENIKGFIGQVVELGKQAWITIGPIVEFIAQAVGLKGILIAVASVIALSAVVSVISFISAAWGAVAAVGALVVALAPLLLPIAAVAAAIYGLKVAWDVNLFGIQEKTAAVFDWLQATFTDFPKAISTIKDAFMEWGSGAMSKLADGFTVAKNIASDSLQLVMVDIQTHGAAYAAGAFAGRLYEAARGALLRFGEGLMASSPNIASDMTSALNALIDGFNAMMDSFKEHAYGTANSLLTRLGDGLRSVNLGGTMSEALGTIVNTFNGVMDGFREHVGGVMRGIGRNIMDSMAGGIRDAARSVLDALNWVTGSIPKWVKDQLGIGSPSTVFEGFGENLMQGLALGMKNLADQPQKLLEGITGGLNATLGGMSLATGGGTSTVNNSRSTTNNFTLPGSVAGGTQEDDTLRVYRTLSALYAQ